MAEKDEKTFDLKIVQDAEAPTQPPETAGMNLPGVMGQPEKPETQARVALKMRKTLDGTFMIFDHPDIDIAIMPQMFKIVAFSKEDMGEHIYATQSRLFDFLSKKGVIVLDSVQGGNLYGSLEANIPSPADQNVDPIDVAIYVIAKFIDEEKPFYDRSEKYKDDIENWMLEPDDDHSTSLDWAEKTHGTKKGVQNRWPGSTAAYGLTGMYRA